MTTTETELPDAGLWMTTEPIRGPKRRRARGLRLPILPSWPLVSQVGGAAMVLLGTYLRFGIAVTLIVGGVAAVILGVLRESDRI